MKISDILVESSQVQEAPMGVLSKLGNKALSKLGSGTAQGKLETGEHANRLKKEFQTYLGRTGGTAEVKTVLAFLKSKGIPTQGAETALKNTASAGDQLKAAGQKIIGGAKAAGGAVAGAAKAVGKGVADVARGAVQGAQAELGKQAPADQATAAVKGTADPAAATQAEPAKPHTGGKVAGQVSQTPNAQRLRVQRAAKKTAPAQKLVAGVYEALAGNQLDAAFLAAAQDAARAGVEPLAPSADNASGANTEKPKQGGVGSALKAIGKGIASGVTDAEDEKPSADGIPQGIEKQLAKLNPEQKKQLYAML
jgi:hypothetical protein